MSTNDRVIIFITYLVGFLTVAMVLSVIFAIFFIPNAKIAGIVEMLSNVLTMLVGALVGYIGGKAVGKNEALGEL